MRRSKMEMKVLHYIAAPGIYHSNLWVKGLQHISGVQRSTNLQGKGLSAAEILGHVNYFVVLDIWRAHFGSIRTASILQWVSGKKLFT